MQLDLKLSKNLVLHYIEENMVRNDELVSVYLSFTFFCEHGSAYLTLESLEKNWPSYAMTEISSELSDSFNELIEEDSVFKQIKEKVELYAKDWKESCTND